MHLVNIKEEKQVNDFVSAQPMSQFLQCYDWGKFQAKVSGQVNWLGVMHEGKLLASAQLVSKELPIGQKYLYCARGPVIAKNNKRKVDVVRLIYAGIEKLAQEQGLMFLRFEPSDKSQITDLPHGKHHHYFGQKSKRGIKYKIIKTIDVQPPKTLMLDLSQSESELLKAMHQKTRYNINLAIKKGVKIVEGGQARFEDFWRLLDQTTGRDKFRSHGRNYYQAMLEMPPSLIKLFFAEYHGQPIATAMVSFFGDTVAYLHGGSANEERNTMAPYLLQWQMIKAAREQGYKYYDFYGIDEKRWPGVTRFKKGFGGSEVNYPGTYDLVYDTGWYRIYKMVRKVRRTF